MTVKFICVTTLVLAFAVNCGTPSPDAGTGFVSKDSRLAVGTGPGMVNIADVNGDGALDVIVANEASNNVTILLGDGRGGFSQSAGSPFPAGHNPNDIAIGDFNRDGKLDLAFANHEEQSLTVLLGDGRGGFAPAPNSPFTVRVRPHPHGLAAGDLNSDGNIDLVTESWADNKVVVLFGDGKGGFATPGTSFAVGKHPYQRLRVSDLDRDGHPDIITTNLDGADATVLLGDGRGGFKPSAGSPFPCGDAPFNLAVGDANNDGIPDLAIVNAPGSTADQHGKEGLTILIGDGKGGFARMKGSPFATGTLPNYVAIGDINADGIGDIAVSSPDGNSVTLFLMNRQGVASSSTVSIGGKPKGLAIRDLNGDGKGDIVVTQNSDNTVTVMLTN